MKRHSPKDTFPPQAEGLAAASSQPDWRLIDVHRCDDARGSLHFCEGEKDLPFSIARLFWITDVPAGAERGSHAHRTCAEVVFAVCGGFDIYVDDGVHSETLRIDSPGRGILIPPGVWCSLRHFAPGTVCVVAASQAYDAEGYINQYDDFKKLTTPCK